MSAPAGKIETVVTYLEMTEPPLSPPPFRPAGKLALLRIEDPDVEFYYAELGHIKPFSQAIYGNYDLVERLAGAPVSRFRT